MTENFINDLPKDLVLHIMSLLPLRDAVRTSVLSKDWEYKWASISRILIYDHLLKNKNKDKATFIDFVDRILDHSQNIQNFYLNCRHLRDPTTFKRWISSLSMRTSIQGLNVCVPECNPFTLPRCLLDNTSLISLVLCLPSTLKVPPVKDFLCNLKQLVLVHVHLQNDNAPDYEHDPLTLTLTFPVLVTLELNSCAWGTVKSVEITSPSMKYFGFSSFQAIPNDFLIKVRAPKIRNFLIGGDVQLSNFHLPASSLVSATFHFVIRAHPFSQVGQSNSGLSIRDFSTLAILKIFARLNKTYAQLNPGHALPRFHQLKRLLLHTCGRIEAFLELLHMAPNLEGLVLAPHPSKDHYSEDFNFDAVESVPSCVSRLTRIEFSGILGTKCELGLMMFLLKNFVKLDLVLVTFDPNPLIPKAYIERMLLTSPKGSACCSLVFI